MERESWAESFSFLKRGGMEKSSDIEKDMRERKKKGDIVVLDCVIIEKILFFGFLYFH